MSFDNFEERLEEIRVRWVNSSPHPPEGIEIYKGDVKALQNLILELSPSLESSIKGKLRGYASSILSQIEESEEYRQKALEAFHSSKPGENFTNSLQDFYGSQYIEAGKRLSKLMLEAIDLLLNAINEKRKTTESLHPQVVQPQITPQPVREKETIIKEIVKVRCRYCHQLYDESADHCPYCGGK